jgi:hypothetical protein
MTRASFPALPEFADEALAEGPSVSQADRRRTREVLGAELPSLLAPVTASAAGRQRLLTAVSTPPGRYLPFLQRLSELFDLAPARVLEILNRVADAAAWQPGPLPGVELMHLDGGPRLAGADAGLVRMAPRLAFPTHRHSDRERILILDGSYHDDTGKLWRSGDVHEMPAGTTHAYEVSPEGLLFALVLHGAVEIEGIGRFGG